MPQVWESWLQQTEAPINVLSVLSGGWRKAVKESKLQIYGYGNSSLSDWTPARSPILEDSDSHYFDLRGSRDDQDEVLQTSDDSGDELDDGEDHQSMLFQNLSFRASSEDIYLSGSDDIGVPASDFGFTTTSFRESAESVAFHQEDIQMSEIFGTQGIQGDMFCNYPCIQSSQGDDIMSSDVDERFEFMENA